MQFSIMDIQALCGKELQILLINLYLISLVIFLVIITDRAINLIYHKISHHFQLCSFFSRWLGFNAPIQNGAKLLRQEFNSDLCQSECFIHPQRRITNYKKIKKE